MTHDDSLRFSAIRHWAVYAIEGRTPYLEAAEAIEGLAARIRADHSPLDEQVCDRIGTTNEAAGRRLAHVPGHGPDLQGGPDVSERSRSTGQSGRKVEL